MPVPAIIGTFPFASSELTANEGIMYGINEHNDSLVLFDRFSLENANSVIFAKAGAGKSYLVKLEALRSLMFGTEIIVLDPEQEYLPLAQAVGGEYINFSPSSPVKINPFDMAGTIAPGENELGRKILSLTMFLRIVLGNLNSQEAAVLDRALKQTYKLRGISDDPKTQQLPPPLMEDLYKVLIGMEDQVAGNLAIRLERFIKGSLAGIFSSPSNIKIQNLKGKVILVDFWTYTCINCIRTLPYLKDWHDKYADKGSKRVLLDPERGPIIKEMFEKDRHTIASDISREINIRLGIDLDNKYINEVRRKIGLGSYQLSEKETIERLHNSIRNIK